MGNKLKSRCTQKVIAECTGKWRGSGDDKHMKYPVYEFDYEGEHYKVTKEQSGPGLSTDIGSMHEIYINPNNPEEYYHPLADAKVKSFGMIFVIVFGIAFLFQLYLVLSGLLH